MGSRFIKTINYMRYYGDSNNFGLSELEACLILVFCGQTGVRQHLVASPKDPGLIPSSGFCLSVFHMFSIFLTTKK